MPDIVLETTGLTKNFRTRRAVDDLSLQVHEGDVYGFLGPNGAGKSTTIRMLTGLVRPHHGTARLLGYDIRTDRVRALRDVGAIVELPAFYKYLSARENLDIFSRLSGGCDRERIDHVLDTVGLLDRAKDNVKTFSHGMVQRLGIAHALLPSPKVIILDEPTSGLDPQGMRDVRELILRLAKDEGITIFLSSHLLHEIEQVCNRVGIINRGKLVAQGSVQDLLKQEMGVVEFATNDSNRAAEILGRLDSMKIIECSPGLVSVSAVTQQIADANRALVAEGLDVFSIVPKTMNLEDLFMKLIGEGEHAD
jgi:ABC-type multidrug transport system ATPase subunit